MDLIIDKKLLIDDRSSETQVWRRNDNSAWIYGDVCGIWSKEKAWNSDEAIGMLLKTALNKDELISLLRFSIGTFYIVVSNSQSINVYASPGGGGVFYAVKQNKLYISDDEKEFYHQMWGNDLSSFEVLYDVMFGPTNRNLFRTLLNNTSRIPGGNI